MYQEEEAMAKASPTRKERTEENGEKKCLCVNACVCECVDVAVQQKGMKEKRGWRDTRLQESLCMSTRRRKKTRMRIMMCLSSSGRSAFPGAVTSRSSEQGHDRRGLSSSGGCSVKTLSLLLTRCIHAGVFDRIWWKEKRESVRVKNVRNLMGKDEEGEEKEGTQHDVSEGIRGERLCVKTLSLWTKE